MKILKDQRGFTLMELMVASVCTTIVLGGAVALTGQIQNSYRKQMEDSVGEQEARYALEWIGRYLRSAGNDPFNLQVRAILSECPASTGFQAVTPGVDATSISLQSDVNPPDGMIGGSTATGGCVQKNENVTISLNTTLHEVQFQDLGANVTSTTRTDAVIDNLQFTYLKIDSTPWVTSDGAANIYFVRTAITIRSRTTNRSGTTNRSLESIVRVRGR